MSTLIEIEVPDIGDVTDAEIIEVSVSVGDSINKEDTLIVLETDKATMDVPSPSDGEVKEIVCKVGDKVSQGSVIIKIDPNNSSQEVQKPEKVELDVATEKQPHKTETVTSKLDITVPDIGDNDAVEVIEISAHPGDQVEKEDPLIVLETEKATMEIPSPHGGKVLGINVVVGDKVSFGDLIGSIEIVSDDAAAVSTVVDTKESEKKKPEKKEKTPVEVSKPATQSTVAATSNGRLLYASPAIRRFARELGADITNLKGTGTKGRVIKEDVQNFVKAALLSKPSSGSNQASGSGLPIFPAIDFSKFGEVESIPLTKIQKISSTNLHRNWVNIPHVTQNDEADITEMESFRQSMKAEAATEGYKLTPLVFILKAVSATLKAYPRFNASLAADGENLILKKYCNIGVAVETPDGLVVPVVKDVDKKSIYELAADLTELSAKAREKKLGMDSMQGSCFTISSLGGIGGTSFSPIVNWPDVAILGVSKSSMKPIWDGEAFQPRLMLPLCLSYDHRVIDGAVGARFVTHLSKTLGDIRRLTL